jgi:hypothetical protein
MSLKTKNALSTSILKEPIGFNMMMSTIRVNSFGGKYKYIFLIVFLTYLSIGFAQISSVGTHWMLNF